MHGCQECGALAILQRWGGRMLCYECAARHRWWERQIGGHCDIQHDGSEMHVLRRHNGAPQRAPASVVPKMQRS